MTDSTDAVVTDRFAIYNADTIDVARQMESNSVDYSIFSPPFATLFTYSASPRDLGNARGYDEFWEHYRFLVQEQFRVMAPGRVLSAHCMLLPTSKTKDGYIGLRDFRGDLIREYERAGFIFHSEVVIWKCPVNAVTRTKALGLLFKQLRKDSAMSRQGIPDYVVSFRKPGENKKPITKDEDTFPVERWQRYASPVWVTAGEADDEGFLRCSDTEVKEDDSSGINQTNTLNVRAAREHQDEAHLCALQLGVIRRCIRLWSNPGDLVWSPFGGIGSEGYVALLEGRRAILAELKTSYFKQAVKNLRTAEEEARHPKQPTLFDIDAGAATTMELK